MSNATGAFRSIMDGKPFIGFIPQFRNRIQPHTNRDSNCQFIKISIGTVLHGYNSRHTSCSVGHKWCCI